MMSISRPALLRRALGLVSQQAEVLSAGQQFVNTNNNRQMRSIHSFPVMSAAGKSALGQLRKQTGYSLSLCKKALAETEQDVAKAKAWLDERAQAEGWNKANKLEGRNTKQGLVGLQTTKCGTAAAMVELNSETDFVARNKVFHVLLNSIVEVLLARAQTVNASGPDVSIEEMSKEALAEVATPDGKTLGDLVALNIGQIGENLILKRAILFKIGQSQSNQEVKLSALTHPFTAASVDDVAYGRFGSILAYTSDKTNKKVLPNGQSIEALTKQICQHVIGMNPTTVGDPAQEPVRVEKRERLKVDEPRGEGEMPDEDWSQHEDEALINVNTTELVHQPFLANTSLQVKDVLMEAGLEVKRFARFEVGEVKDE